MPSHSCFSHPLCQHRQIPLVAGAIEGAGGGWAEVLSDLKTLLETGKPLYV